MQLARVPVILLRVGASTSSTPFLVGKDAGSADVGRRWPSGDRHVPGQHNKTVHNVNVTGKRNCNRNEDGKTMHTTTMTGLHKKFVEIDAHRCNDVRNEMCDSASTHELLPSVRRSLNLNLGLEASLNKPSLRAKRHNLQVPKAWR